MDESKILKQRAEKLKLLVKAKYSWIAYVLLALIIWMAVQIRTLNLPGLRDVTTGTWTLGPDLDPFLFLRWSQYIVENGSLFAVDTMRYSPLGLATDIELLLHPYLMAFFHKITFSLGITESVTHSAVLYPVFFFAITLVAFFLLSRKLLIHVLGNRDANLAALISSFFLAVIPVFIPRTIAGIPEKESAAFFFFFLALYFFISSWEAKKPRNQYIFALLAGLSTGAMALIWGGFGFIFLILASSILVAYFLNQVTKERAISIAIWIISSFVIMMPFSVRYGFSNLASSITTGLALLALALIIVDALIYKTKLKSLVDKPAIRKIPTKLVSFIIALVLLAIGGTLFFGFDFVSSQIGDIADNLVKPATSRLLETVAENRQPFFTEWSGSIGPVWNGIPIMFWLGFIGSIFLFLAAFRSLRKKERLYLTSTYAFFIISLAFSRYSSNSTFNGTNAASILFLILGFAAFILTFAFYYFKYHKEGELGKLEKISFSLIVLIVFFSLGVISARGLIRLVMILAPPISILASYLLVSSFKRAISPGEKDTKKLLAWALLAIVLIASFYSALVFYNSAQAQASGFAPSTYTQQWQEAMGWVRENTDENAVFGHWWDYGYWVQSLGERATVLDGGNAISYWNHLMGRHALTGTDPDLALEFLYSHNTTHFLIDSTDLGKYGAYSLIGSDETLDRQSYIPNLLKDSSLTRETKDNIVEIYQGGFIINEDILYTDPETQEEIFLPAGRAGVGAVSTSISADGTSVGQPSAIFVDQTLQVNLPLRYAYYNEELIDFGTGVEAGVFVYPRISSNAGGALNIDITGALLYLDSRTVNSMYAKLYLYDEKDIGFNIVHEEEDFVVTQLKSQIADFNHPIIHFNGFRGPIKIWEINYPASTKFNPALVETFYPDSIRLA